MTLGRVDRKRVAAVAVAAMLLVILPADTARADTQLPRLTSFARTSPWEVGGGATFSLRFTATDDMGVRYVGFHFTDRYATTPRGVFVSAYGHDTGGETSVDSIATGTLRKWAPSNKYYLTEIEVVDLNSNTARYMRDGTIERSAGGSGPTSHSLEFWRGDFRVNNPYEDITPPRVTSLALFQNTVKAGEPVIVQYSVWDDRSGVISMGISWSGPEGGSFAASAPQDALIAVGPASGSVPIESPGGEYTLFQVSVTDAQDNTTFYNSDGNPIDTSPPELEDPPPPTWDRELLKVTVDASGVVGDTSAPVLTSISRTTPATVYLGQQISLDYAAGDGSGTGIEHFEAVWQDPRGGNFELSVNKRCGDVTRGPANFHFPRWQTEGTYRLIHVTVRDRIGNSRRYNRDGTAQEFLKAGMTWSNHSFALTGLDFGFDSERRELDYMPPATTDAYCPPVPDVSLVPDDTTLVPGEVVTFAGTVKRASAAVPRPMLAVYSFEGTKPRLLSIRRGNAAGWYGASTAATGSVTAYKSRFLGADGSNPALPANSAGAGVRFVRPTSLSLVASPAAVRYGRGTTLVGRLRRTDTNVALAGYPITLLRRPAGATAFSAVASAVSSTNGWVKFAYTPAINTTYRLRFYGSKTFDDAWSPATPVAVSPRITRYVADASVPSGSRWSVSGTVTPTHAGRSVVLQRAVDGTWRPVATRTLSSTGGYRFSPGTSARGTFLYRIVLPAHWDHAEAGTSSLTITVW